MATIRARLEGVRDWRVEHDEVAWLLADLDRLQADHASMHSAWKSEHSERVRLERENVRLKLLLGRLREWDIMHATGDGDYWSREIDAALGVEEGT